MDKRANNPNIADYGFGGKYRTPEQDAEYRSRKKPRKWSREVCIEQLEELMDILKKKIDGDNFKELSIIIDKMMDIVKYLYPPIQQSKNLNVNVNRAESAESMEKIWLEVQDERRRRIEKKNLDKESDR